MDLDMDRSSIKWGDESSQISIKNSYRADCGEYILTAENSIGSCQASVIVTVIGKICNEFKTLRYLRYLCI